MEKKYKTKLDPKTGLLRIIALRRFSDVRKGEEGGLIEKEENLSQKGDCWVYRNARVYGNARVYDDACIAGNARVYDNAKVFGNALVRGSAGVFGDAKISGYTWVRGCACIYGNVKLYSTDSDIGTSIKNNKDYVILIIERKFYIVSLSNFESHLNGVNVSTVDEDYLKNIQTIRQVYGKEI